MLFNPVYEFETLRRLADKIFRDASSVSATGAYAFSDIYENDKGYMIRMAAPGVKQEDVAVDYENGILSVSLKRNTAIESLKEAKQLRSERSPFEYKRNFRLSDDAVVDGVTAQVKDGILMIFIPKTEKAAPKKIEVKVQ